jgi:heme/copper-type cytochrome/quinol oxidase subunit 3
MEPQKAAGVAAAEADGDVMSLAAPHPSSLSDRPAGTPVLDVSSLPDSAFDWRDPVWWGNTLLMTIETVTIALMIAAYFYIRRNYTTFPPPKVDVFPPIYDTAPKLTAGTINLVLMCVSCVVMYMTDVRARRLDRKGVMAGLIVMILVGAICVWLRWYEFQNLYFWWNDNAFASCEWIILGTHLTYLLATAVEFVLLFAWAATHEELDSHHALDVTLIGGYWYWTAGTMLVVWSVIYLGPRVMGG